MQENFITRFLALKAEINAETQRANKEGTPCAFSDKALECFRLLSDFVKRACFKPTKRNKELMRLVEYDNAEIARRLGISVNTVRSQKSVAAKLLEEQVKGDCFNIIRQGNERQLDVLITRLRTFKGYQHPEDWLPQEIVQGFDGYDGSDFDIIQTCGRELRLLAMLDKNLVANYVDPQKMAFLLELLSGNQVVGCNASRGRLLHIIFNLQKDFEALVNEEEINKIYL